MHDNYRISMPPEESKITDMKSFSNTMRMKAANLIVKTKVIYVIYIAVFSLTVHRDVKISTSITLQAAFSLSFGFGEESINASAVLVMPMVSSKITGFRGNGLDRTKLFSFRTPSWSRIDEDGENLLETTAMLPQSIK